MELKPGDVVMLKSGGHPVTGAEVNEERSSVCGWWQGICSETLPKARPRSLRNDDPQDEAADQDEDETEDARSE